MHSRMSRLLAVLMVLALSALATGMTAQASPFANSSGPSSPAGAAFAENDADFLPVDQAFQAYAWHDAERVYVGLRSQPGYYLYRHSFALDAERGAALNPIDVPDGTLKRDPYFGDVHVFHDDVVISAPLTGAQGTIPVTLSFQGCADAGLCYPPEQWTLSARAGPAPTAFVDSSSQAQASPITPGDGNPFSQPGADGPSLTGARFTAPSDALAGTDSAVEPASPVAVAPTVTSSVGAPANQRFESLLNAGIALSTLGLFFLAGLGLTLTPCVLPMVPILVSIIVGQNASRGRAFVLSLSYVAGMAVTFTALGTLMGVFGASLNLQARLQSPWVLIPLAILFALFAMAMFGGFDLRLPRGMSQRVNAWQDRSRRSGPLGLGIAGALSVLVVSPCISAPLAGALVFISTTGDALGGALALLALALGMGLPLILAGSLGTRWLPRAGAWMNGVKSLFGVMLLAVAIWLVERLLPGQIALVLWGALALGAGLALGALETRPRGAGSRLLQTAGWLLLIWGVALVWGAAQGHRDPLRPLAEGTPTVSTNIVDRFESVTDLAGLEAALNTAEQQGRPVMVDVSADWCISCQVMEHDVFPAPSVASRLADFTLVRADVTDTDSASRALLSRYDLFGPPALLFFANGEEISDARIQGEIDAAALAAHLTAITKS